MDSLIYLPRPAYGRTKNYSISPFAMRHASLESLSIIRGGRFPSFELAVATIDALLISVRPEDPVIESVRGRPVHSVCTVRRLCGRAADAASAVARPAARSACGLLRPGNEAENAPAIR